MELKSDQLQIHAKEKIVDKPNKPGTRISEQEVNRLIGEALEKAQSEILQDYQTSFITVFGIFASVLSFLTIEFQLLKTLKTAKETIGFTLVLWVLLVSFNLALDYIIKSRSSKLGFSVVIIFVFIIGFMFLLF